MNTVYCENYKQVRQYTVSAATVRELSPHAIKVWNPRIRKNQLDATGIDVYSH